MKRFKQQLHSPHSPEDTWEVLKTPVWKPLSETVYPHLSVSYIELDVSTNLFRQDSRTIIRPARGKHRLHARELQLPGSVSMKIVELAGGKRRDVFTENEVVEGFIERRVEAGVGNTSILMVEGEFAMKGMAKFLATFSRIGGQPPERLIFESNQKILDLTPAILADHAYTQNQRQELVSNSA
jgi:hypothetical protein